MIRKSFLIQLKEGMADEYVKRHDNIWPELKKTLKDHGISNYSIFMHEHSGMLFGYMEITSEPLLEQLARNEVMQRWWRYMTDVLESEDEFSQKAKEQSLKEVFHLS